MQVWDQGVPRARGDEPGLFGGGNKSQTTISNVTSTDNRVVMAEGAQLATNGSALNVSSTVSNYVQTGPVGSLGLDGWAAAPVNHIQAAAAAAESTGVGASKLPASTLILAGVLAVLLFRGVRRG